MTKTGQTGGLQSLQCMQGCAFCPWSLKGPWRIFAAQSPSLTCHSYLWQLVSHSSPPHPSPFLLLYYLGHSQSSFSIPACGSRSHFHVSGTPISVTAPCLPVSLENSQPWSGYQQERSFSSPWPGNCEMSSANTSQPDHHLVWSNIHIYSDPLTKTPVVHVHVEMYYLLIKWNQWHE